MEIELRTRRMLPLYYQSSDLEFKETTSRAVSLFLPRATPLADLHQAGRGALRRAHALAALVWTLHRTNKYRHQFTAHIEANLYMSISEIAVTTCTNDRDLFRGEDRSDKDGERESPTRPVLPVHVGSRDPRPAGVPSQRT